MLSINDARFMYHWTKAEKAIKNGDITKSNKHKTKVKQLLLKKNRKGS